MAVLPGPVHPLPHLEENGDKCIEETFRLLWSVLEKFDSCHRLWGWS